MTTSRATRVSRALTHGAVTLALGVGLASFPSQAGAAAPAAPRGAATPASASPTLPAENVALTWAPLYMSDDHAYTRAEALALARRFDLVSAMPYGLRDHSAAMRAANPDLTLLAYSNATLASAGTAAGLPETAFAHGPDGERIKANGWDTWLMQPDNTQLAHGRRPALPRPLGPRRLRRLPGRHAHAGHLCPRLHDRDPRRPGHRTALHPAPVPRPDDRPRRRPACPQPAPRPGRQHGRERLPLLACRRPSRPLVASSPSAQMEDFLRGAGDRADAWPSVEDWQEDVAVVTDMESADKVGLFTTKVWSGASATVAAQWQGYAMATFLMGADGHSFFAFTRSRDRAGASQTNAAYEMPDGLGQPDGAMRALPSGARVRDFAGGRALVNPTGSPVSLTVTRAATRLDGSRGAGRRDLVLAAHSGEILTYGDEDPPTEDPPTEDPPTEDPPTEDPPTEDPPTEDPPAEDPPVEEAPEPSSDVDVVSSSLAGWPGPARSLEPDPRRAGEQRRRDRPPRRAARRWSRGAGTAACRAGAVGRPSTARVRVAVRASRRGPRVLVVRLVYVAGGERVVERVRVRVARR